MYNKNKNIKLTIRKQNLWKLRNQLNTMNNFISIKPQTLIPTNTSYHPNPIYLITNIFFYQLFSNYTEIEYKIIIENPFLLLETYKNY